MSVLLAVRNESRHKRLYTRPRLASLAERICRAEGVGTDVEISLLCCGDETIATLNREYRGKDEATDVLSFPQPEPFAGVSPRLLGDVVISLDTVARDCDGDRSRMRAEVLFLLCHGILHLLGYTHDTQPDRDRMAAKQAQYLNVPLEAAWHWEASVDLC